MTNSMNLHRAKFRPVLSQSAIQHILCLARADMTTASLEVIGALAAFEYKINQGAVSPTYIAAPVKDLSVDLGFTTPKLDNAEEIQSYRSTLYNLWLTEPSKISVHQLAEVRRYRYENELMTEGEVEVYEKEILGLT